MSNEIDMVLEKLKELQDAFDNAQLTFVNKDKLKDIQQEMMCMYYRNISASICLGGDLPNSDEVYGQAREELKAFFESIELKVLI